MLCYVFFFFLNLVSLIYPILDGLERGDDLSEIPSDDKNGVLVLDVIPSEKASTEDGDPGLSKSYGLLMRCFFYFLWLPI